MVRRVGGAGRVFVTRVGIAMQNGVSTVEVVRIYICEGSVNLVASFEDVGMSFGAIDDDSH